MRRGLLLPILNSLFSIHHYLEVSVHLKIATAPLTLAGMLLVGGCQSSHSEPPPPRVESTQERMYTAQPTYAKPLPPPAYEMQNPPPPFPDAPLVSQRLPEEQSFVNAYNAVGRPRIVVFVNRTLEGEIVPVNPDAPLATVDRRVTSTTGGSMETTSSRSRGYYDNRTTNDRVATNGPGEIHDTTSVYLRPGQYDEVAAKSLDYEAIESILTDWLAADGRVAIVSPTIARQRLTDEQVRELQSGRARVAREAAQQLDAPILIQLQAHPTRQTPQGLEVRVIAEAIDVSHNGGSLARAVVDIPPPLEKTQINYYTRYLARKLEDGMTASWSAFGAPPASGQSPAGQNPGTQPPLPGQQGYVPPSNPSAPNPSNVPPPQGSSGNGGLAPNPANPLPEQSLPLAPQTQPTTK